MNVYLAGIIPRIESVLIGAIHRAAIVFSYRPKCGLTSNLKAEHNAGHIYENKEGAEKAVVPSVRKIVVHGDYPFNDLTGAKDWTRSSASTAN